MKKFLTILFLLMFTTILGAFAQNNALEILTLFSSKSNSQNKLWVGTFQLAYNDMINNIVKRDIKFQGESPSYNLKGLNKGEFNKSMLDENSYYTSYGLVSFEEKEKIKNGIKEKFNETSDILDSIDWTPEPFKYYAYAMLKKEFEFLEPFDELQNSSFNNSKKEYKYFGINKKSKGILDENVKVLFYNNENDYAVQLLTKSGDVLYLYRNDSDDKLNSLYNKMKKQSEKFKGEKIFLSKDTLKVPNLKINEERKYPELCNKKIKGTDLYFSDAIETIQLEMNNKGAKVKSEAAIIMKMALAPNFVNEKPRHFNFDKTFVLFLVDKGKNDPYLALGVKNLENLQ